MAFMFNARQPASVSTRARAEAYAGLLLLLFAVTTLAFYRSEPSRREGGCETVGVRRPVGSVPLVRGDLVEDRRISIGNAMNDGGSHHGWWIGHFISGNTPRHTQDVETKWISHLKGDKHQGVAYNRVATTLAILISGKHRVILPHADVLLEYPGDYVIWGPYIEHSWVAVEDSVMLCVRWPSVRDDQIGHAGIGQNSSEDAIRTASRVEESMRNWAGINGEKIAKALSKEQADASRNSSNRGRPTG